MDVHLKQLKQKKLHFLMGILGLLLVIGITYWRIPGVTSAITGLNQFIYDQIVKSHLRKDIRPVRVVIIDIDDKSVQQEGRWPWPRDKFARLLTVLKQSGVVVAGLDIVMSEPEINYAIGLKKKLEHLNPDDKVENAERRIWLDKIAPAVDNDLAFEQVLRDYEVVFGFLFHDERDVKKGQLPPPLIAEDGKPYDASEYTIHAFHGYNGIFKNFILATQHGGFVSNLPDEDGVVRRGLTVAAYDNKLYPSLALGVAMRYLLVDKIKLLSTTWNGKKHLYGFDLGGAFIPADESGQIFIPYWGQAGTLDYYSATDVLQGRVNPAELEGSIAIVGSSMILFADLHDSPVAPLFPGVEMVGNLVTGITGQQIIKPYFWQTTQGVLIMAGVGLVLAFILPLLNTFSMLLVVFAALVVTLSVSLSLFVMKSMYFPPGNVLILIALLGAINYIYEFILVKRQKSRINHLFGQYVPEAYVKDLLESPERYTMEGQTRVMTAFFTDIRSFTSLSEKLDAAGVKRLLNTFFTPLTEIIFNHQGTIDKYVGDMIMAFWGAPMEDPLHATHAISASLEIFKKLSVINANMVEKGLPEVNIGVGLATGLMNVGDMGSEFRRAYTVLGDTVNLASRLQDLTKFYQVNILVNDENREGQDQFLWRPIDKVAVKGRQKATIIYQPICDISEATEALREELNSYDNALIAYYAQDWATAEVQLKALAERNTACYVYRMYLERIAEFKLTPPPADWSGVYIHLHK